MVESLSQHFRQGNFAKCIEVYEYLLTQAQEVLFLY